ncbi:hypothetical protein Tco_1550884, partial [Tanacetum coccineum]
LPPTISSLSVSSGFGNQFLNLSSNISLVRTVKDFVNVEINSLLDIQIQQDVPQIQSPTLFNVPVSVIPEQPVPAPSPTLTTKTPVSTVLHYPPPVTAISSVLQQSTPIPTPPITIVALSKKISSMSIVRETLQKNQTFPAQSFVTPAQPTYRVVESLFELELKNILFANMVKSQSYLTQDKHQKLYDSLLNSIMLDESIAKGDVNPNKVLKKRDRGDNEDKDPFAGPNQGKKTKRRRTKESESSKKSHPKVIMDAGDNTANDHVINDADQPQDDSVPKTDSAPKNN